MFLDDQSENGSTANVDLNLHAQSNMVAFAKSGFGNFLQGPNSHLASSKNLVSQSHYTDMTDYFLLKDKCAELTQSLSREMEAVRVRELNFKEVILIFLYRFWRVNVQNISVNLIKPAKFVKVKGGVCFY